jgi:hypothetical protein
MVPSSNTARPPIPACRMPPTSLRRLGRMEGDRSWPARRSVMVWHVDCVGEVSRWALSGEGFSTECT